MRTQESITVGCVPPACQPYEWWLPLGGHTYSLPRTYPPTPARTRDSHPGRDLVPGILTHCGQTNACESITFPQLRWRAVKMGSIPILCVLCRRHHTMLKFDSNVDFDALCLKYFRFRLPLPLSVINHIAIWLILEKRYKIYIYNFYVHHGITIWQICTN